MGLCEHLWISWEKMLQCLLFLLLNPIANGKGLMGMKQLVWDVVKQ
jgi:hypothetical protein